MAPRAIGPRAPEIPQYSRWLARSEDWHMGLTRWAPVKVLGEGGFGVVGLWKSTERHPALEHLVIKQSRGQSKMALRQESRHYLRLRNCNDHIARLLRPYHEDAATGADPTFDPEQDPDEDEIRVGRIYLEYCDKGDLFDWIRRRWKNGVYDPPQEKELWQILECLAKAAHALEYGTEYHAQVGQLPQLPAHYRGTVAHFDIKHENILINGPLAGRTDDTYKISDFGLAKLIPLPNSQYMTDWDAEAWNDDVRGRGTFGWRAPEQYWRVSEVSKYPRNFPPTRKNEKPINTKTNIWNISAVIYTLITGQYAVPQLTYRPKFNGRYYLTYGPSVLSKKFRYGDGLLAQLALCLAWDPADRPNASQLLADVSGVLAEYDTNPAAANYQGPYDWSSIGAAPNPYNYVLEYDGAPGKLNKKAYNRLEPNGTEEQPDWVQTQLGKIYLPDNDQNMSRPLLWDLNAGPDVAATPKLSKATQWATQQPNWFVGDDCNVSTAWDEFSYAYSLARVNGVIVPHHNSIPEARNLLWRQVYWSDDYEIQARALVALASPAYERNKKTRYKYARWGRDILLRFVKENVNVLSDARLHRVRNGLRLAREAVSKNVVRKKA